MGGWEEGWVGRGGHVSAVLGQLHLRMERFERFVNNRNRVHDAIRRRPLAVSPKFFAATARAATADADADARGACRGLPESPWWALRW